MKHYLLFLISFILFCTNGRGQNTCDDPLPKMHGNAKMQTNQAGISSTTTDFYVCSNLFSSYLPDSSCMLRWVLKGDLEFADGTKSKTITTANDFRVSVRSNGLAKGRVIFYWGPNDSRWLCNSYVSMDVYKEFSKDTTWRIAGNGCFNINDTLVFSVDPLLTKNINACIGFDNYKWEYPKDLLQVIYASGDTSSVTLKATREATLNDSLLVWYGRENFNDYNKALVKKLRSKPPMPELAELAKGKNLMCVQNYKTYTLTITNAQSNVTYEFDPKGGVEFENKGASKATFHTTGSGYITIRSQYKNDDTADAISIRIIKVQPFFNDNNGFDNETKCISSGENAKISIKTAIVSDINWSVSNCDITKINKEGSKYIKLLTQRGQYQFGVTATLMGCASTSDDATSITKIFHVKPAPTKAIKAFNSVGEEKYCYYNNDTVTFKAIVDMPQSPFAVYDWTLPDGWTRLNSDENSDTITVKINSELTTNTEVTAMVSDSLSECTDIISNVVSINYIVGKPQLISDNSCLNVYCKNNIEIEYAEIAGANEYNWSFGDGLTNSSSSQTSHPFISIQNDGIPGKYAYHISPNLSGKCNSAIEVTDSIAIPQLTDGYALDIAIGLRSGKYTVRVKDPNGNYINAKWFYDDNNLAQNNIEANKIEFFPYDDTEEENFVNGFVTAAFIVKNNGCEHWEAHSFYYNGTSHRDTVRVVDVNTDGLKSIKFTENESNEQKETLTIMPNPASNKFSVKVNPESNTVITLRDMNGKRVYRATSTKTTIVDVPTFNLPNGAYIAIVSQDGKRTTTKVIIKH